MSKYGIISLESGTPVSLLQYSTMSFFKKIRVSGTTNTGWSDKNNPPLLFNRHISGDQSMPFLIWESNTWRISGVSNNSVVDCYLFLKSSLVSKDKWGVEIYNNKGEVVQRSGTSLLNIKTIDREVSATNGLTSVDVGFPCAVLERVNGMHGRPNGSVGGIDIFQVKSIGHGNEIRLFLLQVSRNQGQAFQEIYNRLHLCIDVRDYD
ncbi:hypothetical protein HWB19_gp085 [Cronobacter phage vB_CsaP_009]|uniref:Uncharacterized protein n=1 Tax=Cronobacter phage vB_CsaP_009 TaxID=2699738 RepID=A0A679FGC9_9CAUD|nr:hypothetical protein HWB19_gp085 [Cronobacter phage vB_CsaP_009]BBU72731.1 hypothetical protein [Cronobacter phage vB_CsaP_009]